MSRARFAAALVALSLSLPGALHAAPASGTGAAAEIRRSKERATPAAARARKPGSDSAARAGSAPRTLEDIHIEGEVPVPQVLFVTARDQRRSTPFHHRRYVKSCLQVGESTALPSRVELIGRPPAPASPRR